MLSSQMQLSGVYVGFLLPNTNTVFTDETQDSDLEQIFRDIMSDKDKPGQPETPASHMFQYI